MPMPKRPRFIESHPNIQGFTLEGITHTGDTILSMEEFETIRLSDHLRVTADAMRCRVAKEDTGDVTVKP